MTASTLVSASKIIRKIKTKKLAWQHPVWNSLSEGDEKLWLLALLFKSKHQALNENSN